MQTPQNWLADVNLKARWHPRPTAAGPAPAPPVVDSVRLLHNLRDL